MQTVFFDWMAEYKFNLATTFVILAIYLVFRFIAGPRIRKQAAQGRLKDDAISKALSTLNILLGIGALSSSLIVWGFDFKGLLTLSASILAVTGVALFAGWSILSNVTAFFLLLAHTSYRRGNFIRIIDADNYIEGYISEINLFNTKLISEDREVIIYPNNLLLSRPTLVNPRDRLQGVGKLTMMVADKAK
ncbi:mechanosensitive ion channel domain-containing protein [Alkalimarinus coralli]|uniref:mechanosensitive ion channel domain-containing protein n=1 Tax=Alkalimarinus coralli TaxID=2935863 RepID=UPI00202B3EB4|nr:mechanosensitive ion channel domain-containing protein [Alkalimarinus coralli]